MRISNFLIICILTLASINLKAEKSQQTELTEFFHDYIQGYNLYLENPNNQSAMPQIASHFTYPVMQIPNKGAPVIVTESAQLIKNFSFFVDNLRKNSVAKIVWEKLQVRSLTDNKALAINIANAMDAQGNIVTRLSTLYILHKEDSHWKISAIQPHSISNHINLN